VTQVVRVVWYRFRSTFARRRGGLFAIMLLIALLGGLAMGAVAGARRTQSSFPAYLKHTNGSDLAILNATYGLTGNTAYDAGIVAKIAGLPFVKQIGDDTGVDPNIVPLVPLDMHIAPGEKPPVLSGSLDGEYSTLDRVTLTSGRLADPKRADEVIMSASAARQLGMHIGSVLPMGFFTNAQLQLPDCCSASGKGELAPHLKVDLKLVGIVVFNTQIVEDDIDALGDNPVILTPTLMRALVPCCAYYTFSFIKVEGGARNAPAVQAEIAGAFPSSAGKFRGGPLTSGLVAKAERAIEPESIALGVFGAIAALAALLIAAQLIGRQLRTGADERAVLRALGASPATTVGEGLLGILGAVLLGALLASVAAVGLSPLAPLGPVRRVEHSSIAFDWTVLGLGLAGLAVLLSVAAIAIAFHQAPHRVTRRHQRAQARGSRAARAAAHAGLPTSAVTGIRFALEPRAGSDAVPARSAIVGAILAMIVVISTLTFGTSLRTLVSHPPLYGWNWDYALLAGFSGNQDLPEKQVTTLLDHDPYISAWAGIYFAGADIDGQAVPVLAATPNALVAPPLLSGHGLNAPNQVVLGATTLAQLHKHVGDTVKVNTGQGNPTTLQVVGTATMPAFGHGMAMGTGALLSYRLIPPNQLNKQNSPVPGPNAILIRVHNTADPTAALHSLQQINDTINTPNGGGGDEAGGVIAVLRPAEIVNYRSMGTTPAVLGATLAVGAIVALTLTLIASVRRRRRELALLRTLGFTGRQLAAVVAWQSTIAVGIGVVIGVPLGIITGRWLWSRFAEAIHVVPRPSIPAASIVLIAIGALILANLVAAIPGRRAAGTRAALLLQEE
jgi:hypothetical protein